MSDPEKETAKADKLTMRKLLDKKYGAREHYDFILSLDGKPQKTDDQVFELAWNDYKTEYSGKFSTFKDFVEDRMGYFEYIRTGNITDDDAVDMESWDNNQVGKKGKPHYIREALARFTYRGGGKTRRRKAKTSRRRQTRSRRLRK
jgi:hypothetical protein